MASTSKKPPVNYPFHVARAIANLRKLMRFIKLVLLVVDSRAPLTTLYKGYKEIFGRRRIVLVLNKSDLALKACLKRWVKFL